MGPTSTPTATPVPPTHTPVNPATSTNTPLAALPSGETWRFYYFAGMSRIAMRTSTATTSSLVYFLSDHLGSTSITVNPDGTKLAEMRYYPWGETRYTQGVTPTDYQYTGQRNESALGLYYYNARWYDSYITHFNQPDTIVPDPYNPQSFNRYAYALNNPIRYNDPTGHETCLDDYYWNGQCHSRSDYIKKSLKDDYLWNFEGKWSQEQLKGIYDAATSIQIYVDKLTNGKGLAWMNEYLGGTTFVHGHFPFKPDNSYVSGSTIHISDDWSKGNSPYNPAHIVHELAHVWDNRSAMFNGKPSDASWLGGGDADLLYYWLAGGIPFGIRGINGSGGVLGVGGMPNEYRWIDPFGNPMYGGHSTADYFAETFMYMIYDPSSIPHDSLGWGADPIMDAFIVAEASSLP